MNKESIKQLAYTFGKVLGFVGLAFVIFKLYREYTFDLFLNNFNQVLCIFFPLIIINVIATMIGIIAWHKGYDHYANRDLPYITTFYFFAKTEIAKYLPGNVFHFVGRQALASKMGISQKNMAQASFFTTLVLCTATVVSAFLMALPSNVIPTWLFNLSIAATLGSIILILFIYGSFSISKKLIMLIALTISIGLQGVMLSIIIWQLLPETSFYVLSTMASIYVISWLVGFVTPGASGGLGVREGAFLAIAEFLHVSISMDVVVFSVLLVRFINIIGDVVLYFIASFIKNPFERSFTGVKQ